MSSCPVDHRLEDVKKKLEEQKLFLKEGLYEQCQEALNENYDQTMLNEIFHLLKKYDLDSEEGKAIRHDAFRQLFL